MKNYLCEHKAAELVNIFGLFFNHCSRFGYDFANSIFFTFSWALMFVSEILLYQYMHFTFRLKWYCVYLPAKVLYIFLNSMKMVLDFASSLTSFDRTFNRTYLIFTFM